jgi:hypothetical protein
MLEWAEVALLIACASLMPCVAGGGYSNSVDIFNVTSGAWSTASLSVGRWFLAATSLPNLGVAIFAGGCKTCCHVDFRIFACCVVRVGESDARVDGGCFADCMCKSYAFRSGRQHRLQRCGHLQRDVWILEHCESQRWSKYSCGHIAAEPRSRDLCWRPWYV